MTPSSAPGQTTSPTASACSAGGRKRGSAADCGKYWRMTAAHPAAEAAEGTSGAASAGRERRSWIKIDHRTLGRHQRLLVLAAPSVAGIDPLHRVICFDHGPVFEEIASS